MRPPKFNLRFLIYTKKYIYLEIFYEQPFSRITRKTYAFWIIKAGLPVPVKENEHRIWILQVKIHNLNYFF